MYGGTIPLAHPDLYRFRKTNKDKWFGNIFYNKHYLPSKERCEKEEKDFKKHHLHLEAYNDVLPYKNFDWYRNIDAGKELSHHYR